MFKCRYHINLDLLLISLSQRQLEHSASLVRRSICRSSCTELSSVLTGVRPADLWLWMRSKPWEQLIPAAVVGCTGSVAESQMDSLSWGAVAMSISKGAAVLPWTGLGEPTGPWEWRFAHHSPNIHLPRDRRAPRSPRHPIRRLPFPGQPNHGRQLRLGTGPSAPRAGALRGCPVAWSSGCHFDYLMFDIIMFFKREITHCIEATSFPESFLQSWTNWAIPLRHVQVWENL